MDPKVCDKLLTTHRRGYGVDVEALRGRFPLRRSAGEERYGSGNCVSFAPWMFSGHVGIYRMKKYVSGRPRGPKIGGAPYRGGCALHPRGRLDRFLTCTPSPLDHVRSKNHAPEGFIPFGLRLIFLFFEILK